MGRIARRLLLVAVVVLVAGAAGAQTPFVARPGVFTPPITPAPPLEGTGATAMGTAPPATITAPSTSTFAPAASAPTVTDPAASAVASVQRIVAVSRTVEPGAAAVSAFTVPADRRLVVTDVVITNPGTTPVCGAAVTPGGAPALAPAMTTTTTTAPDGTTTVTGGTGLLTADTAVESGTGVLCVPAQTSLTLALVTGLEFGSGESVMVANQPAAAATTIAAGPLHYHVRGLLVTVF